MGKKSENGSLSKINSLILSYKTMQKTHVKKYLFVCILTFFYVNQSPTFLYSELTESTESKKLEKYKIEILEKIELPKHYHEGIFLNNKNIWISNGKGGKTWVLDVEKKEIVNEIESIGTFTEGIALSDKPHEYWVTDWEEKEIYRVEIKNNIMTKLTDISTDPELPAGILNIDGKIYVITWLRSPTGTKYHVSEFDNNGELISKKQLKDIYEPAHMAWDGENLWVTSWYSKKVYKVDLENLKVIGRFKSPAKDATGIAYDGASFWITGTYDDLYKIELVNEE